MRSSSRRSNIGPRTDFLTGLPNHRFFQATQSVELGRAQRHNYSGEEFTVILPETPLVGAIDAADRIRERISAEQFEGIGNITASIGVSNYPVNALSEEDRIRIADQVRCQDGGRDRVAYFNYQMITRA